MGDSAQPAGGAFYIHDKAGVAEGGWRKALFLSLWFYDYFFLNRVHEYLTPLTFDPLTLRKIDHLLLKVVFWCKVRFLWEDKCYVYSA